MKLEIDGPAGRNEVSDKYRLNYDGIFRKPLLRSDDEDLNNKEKSGDEVNNG